MRSKIGLLVTVLLAAACGSSGTSGNPADPTALSQPVAVGLTLTEVAFMQTLKVPIAKDGQPADRGSLPLVAGRDALVRLYVAPDASWSAKAVTARVKLVTNTPTGTFARVFSTTKTVSAASTDNDLDSTINVAIPGAFLQTASSFVAVLNADGGTAPSGAELPARYPLDGSLTDLNARPGGEKLRVMIVPIQYGADGSNRVADVSDDQIERYRQEFWKLYPAAVVEITTHDPFPWNGAITGPQGQGINTLLDALGKLRGQDNPDSDVYYYGAFMAADNFGNYCSASCITGLSPIGMPYSVGIGFGGPGEGPVSAETAAHEVGHAHGLLHAPCGGAGGPDPNYPTDPAHAQARIGVWGYDQITSVLFDPLVDKGAVKDMMSYCSPTWISDYHYAKLFEKVRGDNKFYADVFRGDTPRWGGQHQAYGVGADGKITRQDLASRERFIAGGEPRDLVWKTVDGSAMGHATARFFPYDHLPGGVLWVPDAPAGAVSAEVDGIVTPQRVRFGLR